MNIKNLRNTRFATTAWLMCHEHFGNEEFVDWEPETLRAVLEEDAGHVPQAVLDKIGVLCGVRKNRLFHERAEAFIPVCNILTNGVHEHGSFIPAGIDDIVWGVMEVYLTDGEQPSKEAFSEQVQRYVGLVLQQHGVDTLPPILGWAQLDQAEHDRTLKALQNDPTPYQVWFEKQQRIVQDIVAFVADRLNAMLQEISDADLKSIDKDFLRHLREKYTKANNDAADPAGEPVRTGG